MHIETFTADSPLYDDFRALADELYEDDPYWSPPADPSPDLQPRCFLMWDSGRVVARACATRIPGEYSMRVGWYECVDDGRFARALLDAVRERAREVGASQIIGPLNGTTWHRYRFADPSDAPPFFLDVHNKPWYVRQWIDAGAAELSSYYSTRFDGLGGYVDYDAHVAAQAARGVTLRDLRADRVEEELRLIHEISVVGFRDNYLYTPISADEFIALYRPIVPLVRPEFVRIAEDESGRAVGFVFAVDNIADRTRRSLVMKSAAVLPEHAGKGLGHLLLESVHHAAAERDYDEIIHALIHRGNRSGRILANRSEPYRTYRLFSMAT
jgi:GNAT superfamily N-acetyltransferase